MRWYVLWCYSWVDECGIILANKSMEGIVCVCWYYLFAHEWVELNENTYTCYTGWVVSDDMNGISVEINISWYTRIKPRVRDEWIVHHIHRDSRWSDLQIWSSTARFWFVPAEQTLYEYLPGTHMLRIVLPAQMMKIRKERIGIMCGKHCSYSFALNWIFSIIYYAIKVDHNY